MFVGQNYNPFHDIMMYRASIKKRRTSLEVLRNIRIKKGGKLHLKLSTLKPNLESR